jgi:hypothetical protein
MTKFGLISTIIISNDVFEIMTKKETNHLEGFLDGNIKWLICTDKQKYFSFIYSFEPMEFVDEY